MTYHYQDVNFKTNIESIFHISDIHIHLNSRHNEYQFVFNKLYDAMNTFILKKKSKSNSNSIDSEGEIVCVITGDILHSKTELLPECIEITRKFFMDIARIIPLIIIAGNHDMNINNEARLDAITPIRNGISSEYPIYYLEKTGVYRFGNVLFSLASVRDYIIIPAENIVRNEGDTVIALYHGRINGAQTFGGFKLEGEVNRKTNKTITTTCFTGYDMVLMGDIHLQQFFNVGDKSGNAAYAGSLIQQNHGEDRNGHGYILWTVPTRTGVFNELENEFSAYVSITLKNGKMADKMNKCFEGDLGLIHCKTCNLPKNIHLRLFHEGTGNLQLQEFISALKTHHNVVSVVFQEVDKIENESSKIEGKEGTDSNSSASLKITHPEYQNSLIDEYLKGVGCPETTIEHIKTLNSAANETLEKTEYLNCGTRWKLLSLEFSNLFSFGGDNKIDFSSYKGIVGIIAPNHYGKSSILDIILFTLFDKVPRKGNVKDIINNRSNTFYSKLVFSIGSWHYIVEKSGSVNSIGKSTMKAKFYRFDPDSNKKETLDEETVAKTKNIILRYIGDFEDMIQTNISLQNNNCIFIDAENTVRRKELERIIQIDFLNELTKAASDNINEKKAVLKHLNSKSPASVALVLEKNIITVEGKLKDARIRLPELEIKKKKILVKIKDLQMKINPGVEEKYNSLLKSISCNGSSGSSGRENNELDIKKVETKFQNELKDLESQKLKLIGKLNFKYSLEAAEEFIRDFESSKMALNNGELDYSNKLKEKNKELEYVLSSKKYIDMKDNGFEGSLNVILERIENKKKSKLMFLEFKKETEATLIELEVKLKNKLENLKTLNELKEKEQHRIEKLPSGIIKFIEDTNILELKELFRLKYECFLDYLKPHKRKNGLEVLVFELLDLKSKIGTYEFVNGFNLEVGVNDGEELSVVLEVNNGLNEELDVDIENELEDARNELNGLDTQIKELDDWIIKAEEYSDVLKWNNDIEMKVKNIRMERSLLEAQMNNSNSKVKIMDETMLNLKSIMLLDSRIKEVMGRYDTYNMNVKINKETLDELKIACNEYRMYLRELEIEETRMKEIDEAMMTLNKEILGFETSIITYREKLEGVRDDIKNIKILEKELKILGYYVDALKNLPYMIISKVIPMLEKQINKFLGNTTDFIIKVVVEGTRIDLYLDRPIYNGKMILLNNASGYERFISSLAIRLALMEISQLPKPNFIAIDEGWTSFDFNNLHNVGVVFDYLVSKFDFVINISHLQSIREHCHYHLNLKKDKEGFSCIE